MAPHGYKKRGCLLQHVEVASLGEVVLLQVTAPKARWQHTTSVVQAAQARCDACHKIAHCYSSVPVDCRPAASTLPPGFPPNVQPAPTPRGKVYTFMCAWGPAVAKHSTTMGSTAAHWAGWRRCGTRLPRAPLRGHFGRGRTLDQLSSSQDARLVSQLITGGANLLTYPLGRVV